MKKFIFITIILFALSINSNVATTNLRGQIVKNVSGHYSAVQNVRVDFMTWNGHAWASYSYAVTGADGFYYFMNFPVGTRFLLMVNGAYYPPQPLTINPMSAGSYQDLPVISI